MYVTTDTEICTYIYIEVNDAKTTPSESLSTTSKASWNIAIWSSVHAFAIVFLQQGRLNRSEN